MTTNPRADAVVRVARRRDIPEVLRLWFEADAPPGATDDPESLRALIDHDDALLVAEAGGRLIGSLIAAWDGWRGNMYRLAVHPLHRGQGVGQLLIEAGEKHLRVRGARRITALVVANDEHAVQAWRAAGYRHDAPMARFVKQLKR